MTSFQLALSGFPELLLHTQLISACNCFPPPGWPNSIFATVSKEEAFQYLDDGQAAQIYELVGGRMIHLKSIADEIRRDRTLEGMCTACYAENSVRFSQPVIAMCQTMFSYAEQQLKSAEILPKCRYHKEGAVILRELLNKGSIPPSTYYDLVDAETGDKLLETNILALPFNSREITFQSTVMKRFCEENSALWEGK